MMCYQFTKKILFSMDPERAHQLTLTGLNAAAKLGYQQQLASQPVNVMGLVFKNPIGLAAGFDNNGECISGVESLGFGFMELGGVTPRAQAGNPKPRVFRLVEDNAVINRKGFCNEGVDYCVANIKKSKPLGISCMVP